jgi:hypothetical protein
MVNMYSINILWLDLYASERMCILVLVPEHELHVRHVWRNKTRSDPLRLCLWSFSEIAVCPLPACLYLNLSSYQLTKY